MDYFSIERNEIIPLLPSSSGSILDVGCGRGTTLNLLHSQYPSADLLGVEINHEVSTTAKWPVLVGSIDENRIRMRLEDSGPYDLILAMDILEHLTDPWETLRYLSSILAKGGQIILSLPNISNAKVLLPLIFNDSFSYVEAGILDKTHLRFFTKKTACDLVLSSGLEIMQIIPTGPTCRHKVRSAKGWIAYMMNRMTFRSFERFIAHQWIVVATS